MLLTLNQPVELMSRLLGRDPTVLAARPQVTRLLAFGVKRGATREVPRAQGKVVIHCRRGTAWIVHDGEPQDVVLRAGRSYVVKGGNRMTAHALNEDCGLEIQVDA